MRQRAVGLITLLGAAVLTSGCTIIVGGNARPAAHVTARPVIGPAIQQVMVGDKALSGIFDQPFRLGRLPGPRVGSQEVLRNDAAQWPPDCLGVARMLEHDVYRSLGVRNVAVETWKPSTSRAPVLDVEEGVVSFASPRDVQGLFDTFAAQWRGCDGARQAFTVGQTKVDATIANVDVDPSVLAAVVWLHFPSLGLQPDSIQTARALGMRGNCLVEVKVDYSDRFTPARPRPDELNTSAVTVARAMMYNISSLP